MVWVMNEDAAIKAKFENLTVTDTNAPSGGRPVPVRFRLPEVELANVEFPFVLLQFLGMHKDDEREHRGATSLQYIPEEAQDIDWVTRVSPLTTVPWDPYDLTVSNQDVIAKSPVKVEDFPIPYAIDYQVTVYCRTQQHVVQLISALAKRDRIPARFGYVVVPQDQTVRSLFLTGGPDLDERRDQDDKRLFLISYTVRVLTELLLDEVTQIEGWVNEVVLNIDTIPFPMHGDPTYVPPNRPAGFGLEPFGQNPFGDPF